jgi:hypothetical protein
MRILSIESTPFSSLPYLNAAGKGRVEEVALPFVRARVDRLPDGVDAIVAAADLQGRELVKNWRAYLPGGRIPLLGFAVARRLEELALEGELPPLERVGVLLGGDLYTVPTLDRRGGLGDVGPVWAALAERCAWVAGVLGNHDEVDGRPPHLLDGDVRSFGGVRIGGVGGIIGDARKPNRKGEDRFLDAIGRVITAGADVLLMHEGPDAGAPLIGHPAIRATLEQLARWRKPMPLVVCGHSWWPVPLAELDGGVQVLKVDARVVVLVR